MKKKMNDWQFGNNQLMIMAAFRYCLGRQSYIVGCCTEWLRTIWNDIEPNIQNVIMRDLITALQDGEVGAECDTAEWRALAQWIWLDMDSKGKAWVKYAVAWKHKPWPLPLGGDVP